MNRIAEKCPICDQLGIWIDVEVEPTSVFRDGAEVVNFKIKPGLISCTKCMKAFELSIHECGRHQLKAL